MRVGYWLFCGHSNKWVLEHALHTVYMLTLQGVAMHSMHHLSCAVFSASKSMSQLHVCLKMGSPAVAWVHAQYTY